MTPSRGLGLTPRDRYRGALLGLAAGDAVGTTLEFRARGTFEPIDDMIGGGPFDLAPGQWTDDTSMALCLATSLVERGGFDAHDQMTRYCNWSHHGYLSSTGHCFDIGGTISAALARFERDGNPFAGSSDPRSAGNGSLMRLAPVVMCYHPDRASAWNYARKSSRTTHAAAEALDACELFARMLCAALDGEPKRSVLAQAAPPDASARLRSIAAGDYCQRDEDAIRGTGYVVDCLEAALWCFERTASFRDAVLHAANLGDDADTTAAVAGQIAGAYYGEDGIPAAWRDKLAMRALIDSLSNALFAASPASTETNP